MGDYFVVMMFLFTSGATLWVGTSIFLSNIYIERNRQ